MRLPLKEQAEMAGRIQDLIDKEITCVSVWKDLFKIASLLRHKEKEGQSGLFTIIVLEHKH